MEIASSRSFASEPSIVRVYQFLKSVRAGVFLYWSFGVFVCFIFSDSWTTHDPKSVRARESQRISRSSRSISFSFPNTETISTRSLFEKRIDTIVPSL